MAASEILQNLVQSHSTGFTENLIQLFRYKTRTFREINEEVDSYSNGFFSDGLQLGEIKVSQMGDLEKDDDLIIYTFKTKKELTERSGKKAQYDLAKKILKQEQRYSAGFFIFYDNNSSFRFSLIYDVPQSNGKREWSNFRRFTYYVNKDHTNKTFLYRLDVADFTSFEKVKETFSVEKVTKEFYSEIANWYFWALKFVEFPKDAEAEKNGKNVALIRFITRIIFIWFMKQKKLIKDNLFDKNEVKNILKVFSDKESTYYKAILQNLFFATLNTPINERKFRKDNSFQGKNGNYMEHNYYRFHSLFKNSEDMLSIFKDIPFLNGGLFECLDKAKNDPSNDSNREIRIDGFSDKPDSQTTFPNFLFFDGENEVDLNKDYGTTSKRYKARGLINILQSYNFTIDENTPTDEEIALDPELLGRVFENLLASYNPETASTARKATGSYYTPREIVNYMVDESLIVYLKNKIIEGAKRYIQLGTEQSDMFGNTSRIGQLKIEEELLPSRWTNKEEELEHELRKLISYSEDSISFTDKETDILINAINRCKILDPAVGSGAFPMGILHKLVLILSKLDPHNNKWKQQQISAIESNITDPKLKRILIEKIEESFSSNELDYGRKLYLIQNCLYGVDIQPIAIQIAKLRFFISLLVDEKVSPGKIGNNFGIEPLPNLETKLVAANTLIGLTQTFTLKSRELEKLENDLFALRRKYFITSSDNEKKTLEMKDRELRQSIKTLLNENQFPAESAENISKWDPYNTNTAADWFDPEWMFGPDLSDGFDIIIANPPYIQLQKDSGRLAKKYEKQNYHSFERTGDIYTLFYEKGYLLLKQNGSLCFITSNKWMRSGYGESLRKYLSGKTNPLLLIDFAGQKIFEVATVDTNILLFSKENNKEKTLACVVKEKVLNNLSVFIRQQGSVNKLSAASAWVILSPIEKRIKEKIETVGTPLKDWDIHINYGIKTGFNDAFIITGEKRKELIEQDPKSEEIIRPILRGRDIKRFGYEYANLYLIATFPSLKIDIEKYPAVKKHLLSFGMHRLEQTGKEYKVNGKTIKARKKTTNKWFETQDSISYWDDFSKQKITWGNLNLKASYAIAPEGFFVNAPCPMIVPANKYLLAILNSKLADYYIRSLGVTRNGGYFEYKPMFVEKLPVPIISEQQQKRFSYIIEVLFEQIKNKKSHYKTEKEIDEMIFKLYALTSEEAAFVRLQ